MAFQYYFQESSGSAPRDNRAIFAVFVAQILRKPKSLLDATITKVFQGSCNTTASEKECYEVLRPLIQQFDSVVILIDSRYAFLNTLHYQLMIQLKAQVDQQRLQPTRVSRTDGTQPGIVIRGLLLFETDNRPSRLRPQSMQPVNMSHLQPEARRGETCLVTGSSYLRITLRQRTAGLDGIVREDQRTAMPQASSSLSPP